MSLESPSEECARISNRQRESSSTVSSEKAARPEASADLTQNTPISSTLHSDDDDDNNDSNNAGVGIAHPTAWNFSMSIPQAPSCTSIEIPAEEIGRGGNRHVYYVCNNPADDWIELPSVTPHQINVTRRMQKFLTGTLDAAVESYPAFPGTEQNYLRAIIARISAGTHVAPQNFYRAGRDNEEEFDEYEEEEEMQDESNNDKAIKVNESYRPLPIEKLSKLDYWQHIKAEILKQGRVCYFDGRILAEYHDSSDDNEDDDEEEASIDGEEAADVVRHKSIPEMPAPLFAACSGDRLTNDIISPWTIRLNDVVESPLVLLQSNVWPGAFAFVKDRICDNIYIGFGRKYSSVNYSPPAAPPLQLDYPHGPDTEEANGASIENNADEDDNVADEVEA